MRTVSIHASSDLLSLALSGCSGGALMGLLAVSLSLPPLQLGACMPPLIMCSLRSVCSSAQLPSRVQASLGPRGAAGQMLSPWHDSYEGVRAIRLRPKTRGSGRFTLFSPFSVLVIE